MATAQEVFGWIKEYFDQEELGYGLYEDNNVLVTGFGLDGKLKRTKIFIKCFDNGFTFNALVEIHADEDCRQRVAEYLMRATYGLKYGNFEMDYSDGEVRYRLTMNCENRVSIPNNIALAIAVSSNILEKYGDGLLAVMFGVKTPEDAIKDAEAGVEDMSDNHDESCCDYDPDDDDDDEEDCDEEELKRQWMIEYFSGKQGYHVDKLEDLDLLKDLINLERLKISNIDPTDLSIVEFPVELKELVISNNAITDISPLSNLKGIEELCFCDNAVSDLSPLTELTNLKTLCIMNNQISDLTPLANLINLENLYISGNDISDLSTLAELTNLQELYISNNDVSDLSPLSKLTKLKKLELISNNVSDLSPLSELYNLRTLHIGSNDIDDISPIETLTELEDLDFCINEVGDFAPLAELTNLRRLCCKENATSDISALADCVCLEELTLCGNNITDLSPLEELDDLQVISARLSGYLDLSPLKNLKDLRKLDLAFSEELTEISALHNLTGLESFYYSPDSVSEEEVLELKQNLPDCDFYPLVTEEDGENAYDYDDGCGDSCGCSGHGH